MKHYKRLTLFSEKCQPVTRVGGDQIHCIPVISGVGGDASHGSRRAVVAPTLLVNAADDALSARDHFCKTQGLF